MPPRHHRTVSDIRTLYRLCRTAGDANDILDLLDAALLDSLEAEIDFPDYGPGITAIFIQAHWPILQASWCEQAAATAGVPVRKTQQDAGALLIVSVDGDVYVLVYGEGHRLVPDGLKDRRFGIAYVARTIDPEKVNSVHRRALGQGGRTDITHVAAGAPWWMLSVHTELQIIRNLGGKAGSDLQLTCAGSSARPVTLHGGVGLRARFGLEGAALIADIREIARVLRGSKPVPGLEIIDHLEPIADLAIIAPLEGDLDDRLGRGETQGITLVAPGEHAENWQDAKTFRVRVGSAAATVTTPEPTLHDIVRRASLQLKPGQRITALKRGTIEAYRDHRQADRLVSIAPYKCLEVEASIASRRFVLMEGHWYELDSDYLAARRARIRSLFHARPSIDLPAWDRAAYPREEDYCLTVPCSVAGYVNLDQKKIPNPLRPSTGTLEICDGLADDDTLVLVKRAASAKPLSHLFWQAINAVQTLIGNASARADFAALVAHHGAGRALAADFIPKKLVFAILHEKGKPITPESLPPFALLALAATADTLNEIGVEVEVVSVSPLPV